MIHIINKTDCCGCNACGDICDYGAITFKTDVEGFWYPTVDKHKCTNCNLCETVCPIINIDMLKKNDLPQPECHAAQHKNFESLFNSTSGSAFAALAERMYKEGGYVGGAVFNEDYSVKQFISSNKTDLEKLRNSKYVQSNSEGFYITVRSLLEAGEKVLICGLPCQMAALRAFLHKDYDNLIIVDLVCLGINSPRILRRYLDYLEIKYRSKIIYYKAKNKELGWDKLTTKVVFENGQVLYDTKDTSYFTRGFISTYVFSRPSCYECKFKGMPRIGDISLGDAWNIKVNKEMDNNLGVSLVLINSKKGKTYYEIVKSSMRDIEIPYDSIFTGNQALNKSIPKPLIDREQFYKDLDILPFEVVAKKYIKLPLEKAYSVKSKIKNIARFFYNITCASDLSIYTWMKNIYYNFFKSAIKTNIKEGKFIVIYKYCTIEINKTATVAINGLFRFGFKRVKGSKLESRLLVEEGSKLIIHGNGSIAYGADIEVFPNSVLEIGKGLAANINTTIICGERIDVGDYVCLGRNVTIRDNSGNHFISRRTFKNRRSVTIGQHSWICEHAIVMPGAKIGIGAIVSARSMVSGKMPNFTLISGSPAVVVDEDVFWKA